jgi:vancomycin resistance protein VanJ
MKRPHTLVGGAVLPGDDGDRGSDAHVRGVRRAESRRGAGRPREARKAGRIVPPPARLVWWLRVLAVLLAVGTLVAALWLHLDADRGTVGTLLLFAPRRVVPALWGLLALAALPVARRVALAALAGAGISLVALAGFQLPFSAPPPVAGTSMFRVVTFNVDFGRDLAIRLEDALDRWRADVVLLQACGDDAATALERYAVRARDAAAGRGAARAPFRLARVAEYCVFTPHDIASAAPVGDAGTDGGVPAPVALDVRIARDGDTVAVQSVHLPSPRDELGVVRRLDLSRLGRAIAARDRGAARIRAHIDTIRLPVVLAGDFNLPPESRILREHFGDLRSAFREAGWGFGYTMAAGIHRLRIDHVLTGSGVWPAQVAVEHGWLTEHRPVIADLRVLAWGGQPADPSDSPLPFTPRD